MLKKHLNRRSIGFWILLAACVMLVVAFGCAMRDSAKMFDTNSTMVTCSVIGIAVVVVAIVLSFLKKHLDLWDLLPMLFVILVMVAMVVYIGDRLDVLGYIFTGHYSFETDYPELGFALVSYIVTLFLGIAANFFKQRSK